MHLTTEQHGAYLLLMFSYYKNRGPLLDDDEAFALITRMTVTVWKKTRSPLSRFFEIREGLWRHKRADMEIKKRESTQLARIQSANKTNAKLGRTVTDTVTDTVTVPYTRARDNHNHNQKSETKLQSEPERARVGNFPSLDEVLTEAELRNYPKAQAESFWNHFEAAGWIDRNGHEIKKWKPKLANWIVNSRNNLANGLIPLLGKKHEDTPEVKRAKEIIKTRRTQ